MRKVILRYSLWATALSLVVFGTTLLFSSTPASAGCKEDFFVSNTDPFKYDPDKPGENYGCVPNYVQRQPYDRCRTGNANQQSVGWFVPKIGGSYEPWVADRRITTSSIVNNKVDMALFATRYVCDNKGGGTTGSGDHYFWFPSINVALGGRGACNIEKSTSQCGSGSGLCRSNYFSEIYTSGWSAEQIIESDNDVMTPKRGTATSSKGYFSGIYANGHYSYLKLKIDRFKELCVNTGGTAGVCHSAGNGLYAVVLAGTPYKTTNSACGNLTPSTSLIAGILPNVSIAVSPFPETSVNKTQIYPNEKATFTHKGAAEIAIEGTLEKDISVKFEVEDGTGATIPRSVIQLGTITLRQNKTSGRLADYNEDFNASLSNVNGKVCRRVKWSYTDLDGSTKTGRGTTRCVTVLKPTLTVTATATTKATNASNNEITTMEPGKRVTFTHSLGLSRSGNYTGDVTTRFTPAFGTSNSITHMPGAGSYKDLTVEYGTIPATGPLPDRTPSTSDTIAETHTATQDDVGKQICRRISYSLTTPNATTRNSINVTTPPNLSGNTTEACVSVPYNYTLTPTISAGGGLGDQPLPPGTSITDIVSTVSNSGPTKSRPTQWVVSHFVLNPGQTLSNTGLGSAQQNSSQPSSHFNPNGSWQNFASGNNKVFMLDPETISNNNFTIPQNAPIGSKYCFALSIQPYIHSSANWSHSRPICIMVSKSPTTQIHGSSLIVPNGAVEGQSVDFLDDVNNASSTRRRYASWVEYDILASRNIVNVTSNAGTLIGNHDVSQSNFWHQLTFANTPNLGNFGSGLTSGRSAWIYEYFNKQATQSISNNYTATSLSLSSITLSNSITYRYQKSSTSLTLSSNSNLFNVPSGKSLVIVKEDGDLIINSNIRYNNSVSRASDIPQVIIIVRNGNIIINPDVTNVDAWLVALGNNNSQGHLKTCNQDTVSVSTCNNPLRVNGPVLVDYLDLLRTYGAERPSNTLEDPAEIFNLRPDAYIWSMSQTNSQPVFSTTLVDEVPARY